MNLVESLLDDMRVKTRVDAEAGDIFDYFHIVTGGCFNVSFQANMPVTRPPRVKSRYSALTACPDARVHISVRRDYIGTRTAIHRVLNGCTIIWPSWRLLSIMPEWCNTTPNMGYLKKYIDKYTVYAAQDGTIATLYYDDRWRVSTVTGMDVSNYKWLGSRTYFEIISELCKSHPEFSFSRLDKSYCYSLLFRHPSFHPFTGSGSHIMFMQAVNTANPGAGVIYDLNIGIPRQEPLDITLDAMVAKSASSLRDYIADPTKFCFGFVLRRKNRAYNPNHKALGGVSSRDAAASPLSSSASAAAAAAAAAADASVDTDPAADAVASAAAADVADTAAPNTNVPKQKVRRERGQPIAYYPNAHTLVRRYRDNPDFVITANWYDGRHNGAVDGCDYVIESRLMQFIRSVVYDLPRGQSGEIFKTPEDRIEYFCLRAKLGGGKIPQIFPRVFPQYSEWFARYDNFFDSLRKELTVAIGCNGGNVAAGRPSDSTTLGRVAGVLYDDIVQHNLNINSAQTASILDDHIKNIDRLLIYHAYFKRIGPPQ